MTRYMPAIAIATCCACPLSASADDAGTTLYMSADIELDFDTVLQERTRHVQGGRARAVLFGEHKRADHFMRSRIEPLKKRNGDTSRDDMFVQFGSSAWDLQIGRFEAWDLGPKGKDTVVNDALGTHYLGNMARGRANNGQTALHVKVSDAIELEFAALRDKMHRVSAMRYSTRFYHGGTIATVGVEHDRSAQKNGAAANLSTKIREITLNLNLGHQRENSGSAVSTMGINAIQGPLGAGLLHSAAKSGNEKGGETTFYAGYTIGSIGIGSSTLIVGASHSIPRGDFRKKAGEKTSLRVRVVILF